LTNVISSKTNSSSSSFLPVLQQLLVNNNSPQQEDTINRGEKRSCSPISSNEKKKSKSKPSLPSNFYSLLAQIHNINNTDDSS
jgi:hypothetical protein